VIQLLRLENLEGYALLLIQQMRGEEVSSYTEIGDKIITMKRHKSNLAEDNPESKLQDA
jgi:hypothetical protein